MTFKSKFETSEPHHRFKGSLSLYYWHQLDLYANKTLFVDLDSNRQWTGSQIKRKSSEVARYLIEQIKLKPTQSCVFFYPNNDKIQLVALGVLFAGGSVCVGSPFDPAAEHLHMLTLMQPALVFVGTKKLQTEMIALKREHNFNYAICLIDDFNLDSPQKISPLEDCCHNCNNIEPPHQLPVLVDPNEPAYVLLTSGSTGKPKAVARSHRNSIYVCHSLNAEAGNLLWDLNETSVLLAHLQLDHGTGTFSTKICLAKGVKMILTDGYELDKFLMAIDRYRVTDFMLGSALLHNFISTPASKLNEYNLSSLRNILSVGSRLPSHSLAIKFMDNYPNVRIRQTFGMTEVGFTSIVESSKCRDDDQTVGLLLPNFKAILIDPESGLEITEPDKIGELYVSGPTVATGYLGSARNSAESSKAFQADGFYRSFDIASFSADGRLRLHGRYNDILCLHDGWKVLPQDIESLLLEHPAIHEAAVVGVPHPSLSTCHAPRAYVVPKRDEQQRLTEKEVFDYVAEHASEPKHLTGGVRILDSLPRARLSKVDKKALLRMDGFLH